MAYGILFGVIVLIAAALSAWVRARSGGIIALVIGVVLTVLTVVLFFANKSDSVADTFLEKLADLSPPLVTLAMVVGWWLGFVLLRAVRGPGR